MKNIKTLCVIALAASITYGCGGGGGSSSTPGTPDGVYTGTITGGDTTLNGNEKAIIYDNRMIVISPSSDIQRVYDSTLNIDKTSFTTTKSITYVGANLDKQADLSSSGSFVASTSVTMNFSDTNTTSPDIPSGIISLSYDSTTSKKTATNDLISGSWSGPYGFWATASLTISTDGTFSGSEDTTGCMFNGTYTIPDATKNVYIINLTSTASCPSLPIADYTGLAWIEGTNNNTLVISVSDADRSRALILTK